MDRLNRWGLMNSLLALLNDGNCEDSYVTLAKYFLQNYNRLQDLNIYDIAEDCFVSRATVRRLAQALGYANFKELKEQFDDFHENYGFYRAQIAGNGVPMAEQLYQMARDIDHQILLQPIEPLVNQIAHSREVVFLCSDVYSRHSSDFQKAMILAGKMVRVVSSVYEEHSVLNQMTHSDLLIVTSVSGFFARESLNLVSQLNSYKVLLTTFRAQELEQKYDEIRYMSSSMQRQTRSIYALFGIEYYLENISSLYLQKYGN